MTDRATLRGTAIRLIKRFAPSAVRAIGRRGVDWSRARFSPHREFVATGHFYSAVPSAEHLARYRDRIINRSVEAPGIDLNIPAQRRLLAELEPLAAEAPFTDKPNADLRYYYDNKMFRHADGLFLHLMLRYLRPKRVVEVGSGYSSACALDTADRYLDAGVRFIFIDPRDERLRELLRPQDHEHVEILKQEVQAVDLDVFHELAANDLLSIDSTHTVKAGGDVNRLFFEVFPELRSGVVIHLHDVFPGFDYPWSWLQQGRSWTEAYILRAFLQFNRSFEVLLWPGLLAGDDPKMFTKRFFGRTEIKLGGSIYLRRC